MYRLVVISLLLGSASLLRAQDAGNPCFLFNWDTVTGGSGITVIELLGECEYEIDTEGGPTPSTVEMNILETYLPSQTHQIHFSFAANRFNQQLEGDFRILTLNSNDPNTPLLALDVHWTPAPRSGTKLYIEGAVDPKIVAPSLLTGPSIPGPVETASGFGHNIEVLLQFNLSSAAGASDGSIELWVEGQLQGTWSNLYLDWPSVLTPQSVTYGVIDVFNPKTKGILNIRPHSPSVTNPTF